MKIYSWNVNGIRAAVRNGVVSWIKRAKPDILCMQETKAQKEDFPDEIKKIKGYHIYSVSAKKRGYAGVAVLTKQKPKKVVDKIGIRRFDQEGRFLLIEFEDFYLFNTYFPHSQRGLARLDFKKDFNNAYLKFVSKLKGKPVVLTGDFNAAHNEIDLANPKQNENNAGFTEEERDFIDKMVESGWKDTFREIHPKSEKYTWWTYRFNARARNVGWRVDYFFVKEKDMDKVRKADILDHIKGSDHCPIMIDFDI